MPTENFTPGVSTFDRTGKKNITFVGKSASGDVGGGEGCYFEGTILNLTDGDDADNLLVDITIRTAAEDLYTNITMGNGGLATFINDGKTVASSADGGFVAYDDKGWLTSSTNGADASVVTPEDGYLDISYDLNPLIFDWACQDGNGQVHLADANPGPQYRGYIGTTYSTTGPGGIYVYAMDATALGSVNEVIGFTGSTTFPIAETDQAAIGFWLNRTSESNREGIFCGASDTFGLVLAVGQTLELTTVNETISYDLDTDTTGWHHYGLSFQTDGTIDIYFDGVLQGTCGSRTASFDIYQFLYCDGSRVTGAICGIRYYNVAHDFVSDHRLGILVDHIEAGSSNGTTVTTPSIDTTIANFIVIAVSIFKGTSYTLSDSEGNTWTHLTAVEGDSLDKIQIHYCNAPTLAAEHTFSVSAASGSPSISVKAFNLPYSVTFSSQTDVHTSSGTSAQPASITTGQNDCLALTAIGFYPGTGATVNEGFDYDDSVDPVAGQHFGIGFAWKYIPASGTTVDPTWSWTTSSEKCAVLAVFNYDAAATYTGSLNATLGKSTLVASAAFTKPTYAGSLSKSLGNSTLVAAATFTKPTYTGAVNKSLANSTLVAAATFQAPLIIRLICSSGSLGSLISAG